jgi:hypothetical protein
MSATRERALVVLASVFQLRLLASAARLVRLIATAAFALIVLATLAMFSLAGLAAIHRRIVVMPMLALATVLLFGLGGRTVFLLAHFAIYSLCD